MKPDGLIKIPQPKITEILSAKTLFRVTAKKTMFDSLPPDMKVRTVFGWCKLASSVIQKLIDGWVPALQQQDIKSKLYAMKSSQAQYVTFLNSLRYDSPLIGGDSGFDPVMQPWVTFSLAGGSCGDFALLCNYFLAGKLAFVADVKNMSGWHVYFIAADGNVWSHTRSATGIVKKLQGADERTSAKYFNNDWTHCGIASPEFNLTSLTAR